MTNNQSENPCILNEEPNNDTNDKIANKYYFDIFIQTF